MGVEDNAKDIGRLESKVESVQNELTEFKEEMKGINEKISESLEEIVLQRNRDKGFLAGWVAAFTALAALVGFAWDYLIKHLFP